VGPAVRLVEEAQLEGEEIGQRDEHGVGRDLQDPVAVDGVVQPAHRLLSLRCLEVNPYDVARMGPLLLASVTDKVVEPIIEVATDFIGSAGEAAVFLLMVLESACIPVPSEAIMLFAGFAVSKGEMTLFGIVAAGVLGNLVGSWIAYAVGYYGRIDLLEKNKLIHISPKHLKWADDWFARYGNATVF